MIDEQLGSIPMGEDTHNPKELFEIDNVEARTELTAEQVIIVAKIKALSSFIQKKDSKNKTLETFIKDFLELQISKDRGSRKEFVSAMQSKQDVNSQSLLDKITLPSGTK
jgi:hypothetical protein